MRFYSSVSISSFKFVLVTNKVEILNVWFGGPVHSFSFLELCLLSHFSFANTSEAWFFESIVIYYVNAQFFWSPYRSFYDRSLENDVFFYVGKRSFWVSCLVMGILALNFSISSVMLRDLSFLFETRFYLCWVLASRQLCSSAFDISISSFKLVLVTSKVEIVNVGFSRTLFLVYYLICCVILWIECTVLCGWLVLLVALQIFWFGNELSWNGPSFASLTRHKPWNFHYFKVSGRDVNTWGETVIVV